VVMCLCVCVFVFVFVFVFVCCVSVVVSVVCMCSYVTGGYAWYDPPVFWLFVWWTFDMFKRWYYVVCMGWLLLY